MASSDSNLRRVLIFGLCFAPLFMILLWMYQWIMPVYQQGVLAIVNPCLEKLNPPLHIDADAKGDLSAYTPMPGGQRREFFFERYRPYPIYLNLVLLPALLLATPMGVGQRLRLLGLGLVILFFWNVISMIGLFRTQICLIRSPESFACSWLKSLIMTSGQIGSVLGWAVLTWSYWFPKKAE